jgi:DNA-binding MarR family transcriptional regulator
MQHRSHFRNLWDAGYRRIVPIIPPDAAVSEKSSLHKRPGARGKSPGVKGLDGLWRGFDWLKHETVESDLDTWAAMGAGVGVKTGSGLVAVDVDTKNGALCEKIAALIERHLGNGPLRVGNAPKFLVLFACDADEAIPYFRVDFEDGQGQKHPARVELLSAGKQFVAHGVHPATLKPYYWPKGLVAASALTQVTRASVAAFFAALSDALPAASRPMTHASLEGPPPPQESLKGDIDVVRQAIKHLPNTVELFPDYDSYIRVGAAIKGATQDCPDDGEQLWLQWAGRYDGGDFNADEALSHYRRLGDGPFRLGARYLYDHADRHSGGRFNSAAAWFSPVTLEALEAEVDPWQAAEEKERAEKAAHLKILSSAEFVSGFTPPSYLIDGVIQKSYLYTLTARTGHGKTAVTLHMAQAIARGLKFHGKEVEQGRVLFLVGENPDDVRTRWMILGHTDGFDADDINVSFIPHVFDIEAALPAIRREIERGDPVNLVIVDTAQAYSSAVVSDPNNNAEALKYAQKLRMLLSLPGKPTVLVNAHPIKNAGRDQLVPYGGGAFLNEIDGNLTLWSEDNKTTTMHFDGKFRGAGFNPVSFELKQVKSIAVTDAKGRPMPSVVATEITDQDVEEAEEQLTLKENRVLRMLADNPTLGQRDIGAAIGYSLGGVNKVLRRLLAEKLIWQAGPRRGHGLTEKGKRVLREFDCAFEDGETGIFQ